MRSWRIVFKDGTSAEFRTSTDMIEAFREALTKSGAADVMGGAFTSTDGAFVIAMSEVRYIQGMKPCAEPSAEETYT